VHGSLPSPSPTVLSTISKPQSSRNSCYKHVKVKVCPSGLKYYNMKTESALFFDRACGKAVARRRGGRDVTLWSAIKTSYSGMGKNDGLYCL